MDTMKERLEETGKHLYEYFETRSELKKLETLEKVMEAVGASMAAAFIVFIFFFVFVFGSIALAYLLAEWTGRASVGFFIVAGFYFLVGLFFVAFKEQLVKRPFMNGVIKKMYASKAFKSTDGKIENIHQFREEISRLQKRSDELKDALKQDVETFKSWFKPVNLFFSALSSLAQMKWGWAGKSFIFKFLRRILRFFM